ncbi:hypothetical protein DL767_000874 [Monosporascus sp. MG133]|nr:hypothetical protein DL767_000874 [Monosporascus sp. MG133]
MAKLPAPAAEKLMRQSPRHVTLIIILSWIPKDDDDYLLEPLQGPAILAVMKRRARNFAESLNMMLQSIPEGSTCWHNRLSYWIPDPWGNRNGAVTLVGDATHPTTFPDGTSAARRIASRAFRGKCRKGGMSPEAVSVYEREMWQRGREAVVNSNNNNVATHNRIP